MYNELVTKLIYLSRLCWSTVSYERYDVTHVCRYFELAPDSAPLLARVNVADVASGEFYAFRLRIYSTLTELINELHNPEVLDSTLEPLANQHAAMPGMKQTYFHVRCTHASLKFPLLVR